MSLENNLSFDLISLSDFPIGTTVQLKKDFLVSLSKTRKATFSSVHFFHQIVAPHIPFSTFKAYLKPSHPLFQDLHVMLAVCEHLGIEKEELQKNVLAHRFKKSRIIIQNPVLPIKVNPLFPMLVAHMIADGNMCRFSDKSTVYFSYRQYDKTLRLFLIKKTEELFGTVVS